MKRALILVDIQNDFLPGGALAVPRGDEVISVANQLMRMKATFFDRIIATQDWHPADHLSFAANHLGKSPGEIVLLNGQPQILWPVHCLQNRTGSEFASTLDTSFFDHVFRKGNDREIDSYSGFFDQGRRKSTGLSEYLQSEGVTEVFTLGLATDYCVKFTALDAVKEGLKTRVIREGVRAVNLQADDEKKSLDQMCAAGVQIIGLNELLRVVY